MNKSLITPELHTSFGVESEPSVFEIEKEAIIRFAEAISDPNPLYHDEKYAPKRGYRSFIVPPIFLPHYAYPVVKG